MTIIIFMGETFFNHQLSLIIVYPWKNHVNEITKTMQ